MKKISFLLVFIPIFVNAQNFIEGIGKLKLGSSPLVLTEIGYDLDRAIRIDDQADFYKRVYKKYTGSELYQLFPDRNSADGICDASSHPSVKVYYIPNYEPIRGVICRGITLKYYNNSLFYIRVRNPKELEEAIKIKYGEPEVDLQEENKSSTSASGSRITRTDKFFTATYATGNPKITCISTLSEWFNEKGEKNSAYYLIIDTPQTSKVIREYDENKNKESKSKKEKEKVKRLEGL